MHFIHFSHTFPLYERDFAQNKKGAMLEITAPFLIFYAIIPAFLFFILFYAFFIRYLLIILSTTVNTFTNVFAMLYFNFSIMVSNSAASNSVASIICSNEYPFLCIFKITFQFLFACPRQFQLLAPRQFQLL